MAIKLKNIKINVMLFLSFGIILMFVVIIGLIAYIELSRIGSYSHHLYNHVHMVNKTLRDIQKDIYFIENAAIKLKEDEYLNKEEIELLVKEVDHYKGNTKKSFMFLYKNYLGPKADIDSAYIAYTSWKPKNNELKSYSGFSQQNISYSREISRWIQNMNSHNFETVENLYQKSQKDKKTMRNLFSIVIILIFFSSGIIIYSLVLRIKNPLQDLIKVTRQFSHGNYEVRSNYKSTNELGMLTYSFNNLASSVSHQYQQLTEQSQKLEAQRNELIIKNKELKIEKERAESADRLKTSFLLNISHELRTPLNSIIGFSGILLQQLPGPLNEEQIKQMKMLRASGRHLLSLINDILDISKIESGEIKPDIEVFNLNEVIEDVVQQILPSATEKSLLLTFLKNPETQTIESDKKRVTQVLINLVNNAVKFTAKGSVSISGYRNNDLIHIEISDTGIGIKEKDLDNLFTPFLQLENNLIRNYEGSGLGLFISKKLIDMLQGSISVKSELCVGSTFTIILPSSPQTGA